jgi:hypothetical protein
MKHSDQRARFAAGTYDPRSDETRSLELRRFKDLRRQFWRSLTQASSTALLALLVGAWRGVVRPDLPFDGGHFLGFAGALLADWAALFELGGPDIASLKGETLSEKVHPRIFQILFVPGTFVLLCSVLLCRESRVRSLDDSAQLTNRFTKGPTLYCAPTVALDKSDMQ